MNSPERRWDPFAELQSLRSELGRLVGSNFGGRGVTQDIDLEQTDESFTITARLPGVAPEEVALDVDVREVVIRARTEAEVTQTPAVGRTTRAFEYRVALPADVNPDKVDAVMDHGLLTIALPRVVRAGRRTITLGGGRSAVESTPSPADPDAAREMHKPDPT
ncbi:Hsp20/alpha crystallin family protein [Asanoa sp. WMMD1127]|uniref:Hsp20/alpha crystallin family protein n=1 Tax=Asanoa sp. WMMD1127 TaxID=3016107 RepID=UPI0024165184|nr:Hsp20/alpha crystallin family protein [Asanoa sp. WMMD1127]MDG4821546.1 Hsp20/alpha crystallin family protein [Asanoa sp. WMMD1127]